MLNVLRDELEPEIQSHGSKAGKKPLVFCDVTQSYARAGGGIRTYLHEKRAFLNEHTDHRHILIIPGEEDCVRPHGRHLVVEVKSPRVPASPNYRLLLRSRTVRRLFREYCPDFIECQDAYNLPWAALAFREERPSTTLIAGYHSDFPKVYVEHHASRWLGRGIGSGMRNLSYKYAVNLYGKFDARYAVNSEISDNLSGQGAGKVFNLPFGVDLDVFHPGGRDPSLRREFGVPEDAPLLVYAGRIDGEKSASIVYDAFRKLPRAMNAHLIMVGDGPLREVLLQQAGLEDRNLHCPGFVESRETLARYLASADIYVSAMAHETFGISIIEAQATGLPVVGVASGAMPQRVTKGLGLLGAVGDADEMARNIQEVWAQPNHAFRRSQVRAHVASRFSWQNTFEILFKQIYQSGQKNRLEQIWLAGDAGMHLPKAIL